MVSERVALAVGAGDAVVPLSVRVLDFSVVVPTRGEEKRLLALLEALALQTLPPDRREILVVFDGGAATPAARARLDALGARAIERTERRGPGAARNAGAAAARGAWLALTEDDCRPDPDWLSRAAERIAREPALDVVEGETTTPAGRPVRRRDGARPNYLPTNLFVRREAFARAGGYCEAFFDARRGLYFREDSDFGFSLEAAGASVAVAPDIRVTHPAEHPRFLDPLRWAARYEMDPLLERRHPERFRDRIEVTRIGPLRLRRLVLRASMAYLIALFTAGTAWILGEVGLAALLLVVAAASLLPLAVKWRFRPARLLLAPLVPLVQMAAIVRGRIRAAPRARAPSPSPGAGGAPRGG